MRGFFFGDGATEERVAEALTQMKRRSISAEFIISQWFRRFPLGFANRDETEKING